MEDDITITLIVPTFNFFRNTLKQVKEGESSMIKSMKTSMLHKLDSRYNAIQMEYLSQCTFLDPRLKTTVSIDMQSFTERVKDFAMSYTEIIHDTESQSLDTIENAAFSNTHTRREQATASNNTLVTQKGIFVDDASDDDTEITSSNDIINNIFNEIVRYKSVSMKETRKPT